jgi:hypothetical protein
MVTYAVDEVGRFIVGYLFDLFVLLFNKLYISDEG